TANVSQGRFPDGAEPPFLFFAQHTPGAPNTAAGANQPPLLSPIGNRTVDEGQTLTFTAQATDPDAGQTLTFSLLGAPPAAVIHPATGVFTWTTAEADGPGEYAIVVRVTDNGTPPRSASETIVVTVREVNRPPTLWAPSPLTVDEGETLTFTLVAADPDLPPQGFAFSLVSGAPDGLVLDELGNVAWTPGEAHGASSHTVVFRVTDNGVPPLSAITNVVIHVREVDNAPVFEPVSLQVIDELEPFSLLLAARDPDVPPKAVTYALVSGPPGLAVHPVTGLLTWTPNEDQGPGSYSITVGATEAGPGGLTGTLTFSIVVNEQNTAPTLGPIPDFTVADGSLVIFTNVAADVDRPAQKLTFTL
ncbi:MAG TPA: putative Ig domain-containing protein, partial [Verrucomicrobiota bacterium]|nr:putative Ig domain-containing protein [Verrucomicrobiota bacterium]